MFVTNLLSQASNAWGLAGSGVSEGCSKRCQPTAGEGCKGCGATGTPPRVRSERQVCVNVRPFSFSCVFLFVAERVANAVNSKCAAVCLSPFTCEYCMRSNFVSVLITLLLLLCTYERRCPVPYIQHTSCVPPLGMEN